MAKRITTAFSFEETTATVAGQEIYGFFEGDDAVSVEQGASVGTGIIGADGSGIFSQSSDRSAMITLKLMHTSPTHRYLTGLLAQQRGGALNGVAFSVRDSRSNEGGACSQAFITDAATDSKGTNAGVREWKLWTADWQRTLPKEF